MGRECRDCLRDFEITLKSVFHVLCETQKPEPDRDVEGIRIELETIDTRVGDMKLRGCITPGFESYVLRELRGAYEAVDVKDWLALEGHLIGLHGHLTGAGLDQVSKKCQKGE